MCDFFSDFLKIVTDRENLYKICETVITEPAHIFVSAHLGQQNLLVKEYVLRVLQNLCG